MAMSSGSDTKYGRLRELITEHRVGVGVTVGAVVLALILVISFYFIHVINSAVATQSFENISELSEHDTNLIEYNLDSKWDDLENIGKKLEAENPQTILEIQEFLNHECVASDFQAIYIVDEDGQLYTDALRILTTKLAQITNMMQAYDGRFVMRDNTAHTFRELQQQLLTYGVALPDDYREMAGKKFICIMGINDIASLSDKLRINSFDGEGWSSVITGEGDYVISDTTNHALSDMVNYFDELRQGTAVDGGMSIDEIISHIEARETFEFSWITPDGITMSSLSKPLENTDWSFIISVPNSVFFQQSIQLIAVTSGVVVGALIILILIFLFVYIMSIHTMRAHAINQARAEFLSTMSHEIRTPLNGMVGLNYLMEKNIDNKPKLEELLHQNQTSTQYLLSLVNDILDLDKLESGKYQVVVEPCSIEAIVTTVENMQRDVYAQRHIDLIVEEDISHPHVLGDETHIKQVLMNILGNAAKFTSAGGNVHFTTTQTLNPATNIATTTFVIADTGCGMSKEFQEHIFESFSQERNKIKASQKGTGLGMAISSMLIKQMGGTITVDSELNVGTTFTVTLPLQATSAQVDDEVDTDYIDPDALASEIHPGRPLRILLAEDNQLNAGILIDILADENIQVDHAADGRQVVDMFKDSAPGTYDLILMDVVMPEQNGYEATREIRALPREDAKDILIYACTANTYKEDRDMAFEAGMDDFLTKPIEINQMLHLLKHGIREKQGNQGNQGKQNDKPVKE